MPVEQKQLVHGLEKLQSKDTNELILGRLDAVNGMHPDIEIAQSSLAKDLQISRRHATLQKVNGQLVLAPTRGAGPVFVDRMKIDSPQVVSVGSTIALGMENLALFLVEEDENNGAYLEEILGGVFAQALSILARQMTTEKTLEPTSLEVSFGKGAQEFLAGGLINIPVAIGSMQPDGIELKTFPEKYVTSYHAEIKRVVLPEGGEALQIKDQRSTNGTTVNGVEIARNQVKTAPLLSLDGIESDAVPTRKLPFARMEWTTLSEGDVVVFAKKVRADVVKIHRTNGTWYLTLQFDSTLQT